MNPFHQLHENKKEKKIVIRNNYRPCEKTDRVMTDQSSDESKTNRQPELSSDVPDLILDRTILDRAMMDKLPGGRMTDKSSILLDKVSSRPPGLEKSLLSEIAAISAEAQPMTPIKLTNTISDRTSSSSQSGKGKKNKAKGKTKESKEKEKPRVMPQPAPVMPATYSNIAIPIEPILKSSLAHVQNQLGYSYPVYIPENPLADYMKQRLIEHPIIYQIEESHDYPLFLSQFHHIQPSSALQLKSPSLGYASPLNAHMNGILPDYAYVNHYHNSLQQQYQQAQLLNTLIPHILQSTITKKPINIIAPPSLNYPLLGLGTLKYVNFQSPSTSTDNSVDSNLINKLNLLTKSIVYPNGGSSGQLFGGAPGKTSSYSSNKLNKNKLSDSKKDPFKTDSIFDSFSKDFRDKDHPFGKDYQSSGFGKDYQTSGFSKDYQASGFGKDPFAFGKESSGYGSKDYLSSFGKDFNKDFGKDYSSGYQSSFGGGKDASQKGSYSSDSGYLSDSFSSGAQQSNAYPSGYSNDYASTYLGKFNKSEPYFRLPLFRKTAALDDKSDDPKTVKYPLFSPKDEFFSSPFNEPPAISKKEDTDDSFKPIIMYSRLLQEHGSPFVKRNASLSSGQFSNGQFEARSAEPSNGQSDSSLDQRPQFDLNKLELEKFSAENKLEDTDRNFEKKFEFEKMFNFDQKADLKGRVDPQFGQQNQNTMNNPFDSKNPFDLNNPSIPLNGNGELRDLDSSEMINNSTSTSKRTDNSTTADNSLEFDYNR